MRACATRSWRALLVLLPLLLAACQGISPTPNDEPVSEADHARYVKRRVEDAQAFRLQKRFEAAEHQLHLALSGDPDHARAHALMARTLHDLGRKEEAAQHAARARQLSPAPAPPPETPLVPDASGVLLVLLPPEIESPADPEGEWENSHLLHTLATRIHTRLPKAAVSETMPASLGEAEEWLRLQAPRSAISLRVDQARCAESAKDGPFALVSLTVVAARSGALPDEPLRVRAVDDDPSLPPACTDAALSHALELALALPGVASALAAPARPAQDAWPALAVRALLPVHNVQRAREIARGRAEADRDATPPDAASEIEGAERERERESELDAARAMTMRDPETRALEAEVAAERHHRDELLAALRVDELRQRAPTAAEVAVLRIAEIREPDGVGPRLARERAGGRKIEARVLYAPDGSAVARFYFEPVARELVASAPAAGALLLREEDTDQDGVADRWTAYAGTRPVAIWEDRGASGHVNAHILLAADGLSTESIEIDMDGDGRPERVFHYATGTLMGGDQDTNADGSLDRFERFEADGSVASRDEDRDGDGRVDVHSEFRSGRLLRREIRDPALVESLSTSPTSAP
jgi:tetratricopeptide (TPR) repeat protein